MILVWSYFCVIFSHCTLRYCVCPCVWTHIHTHPCTRLIQHTWTDPLSSNTACPQRCQVSTGCETDDSLCSSRARNLSLFRLDTCTSPCSDGYLVAVSHTQGHAIAFLCAFNTYLKMFMFCDSFCLYFYPSICPPPFIHGEGGTQPPLFFFVYLILAKFAYF